MISFSKVFKMLDDMNLQRFGVEIELNTFDGFVRNLNYNKGEYPSGADKVADIISQSLEKTVVLTKWDYTHNNENWVIKPDSSCGIEVCTPVLKGYGGIKEVCSAVDALGKNKVMADSRCSFHVHMDVSSLKKEQLHRLIVHYLEIEHVLFMSLPQHRKFNAYCQIIGCMDLIKNNLHIYDFKSLLHKISDVKYYSINAYHMMKGGGFGDNNNRRRTLEFRVGGHSLCVNSRDAESWLLFLFNMFNTLSKIPIKKGLRCINWVNPIEAIEMMSLGKDCPTHLVKMRDSFVNSILNNGVCNESYLFHREIVGPMIDEFRAYVEKIGVETKDQCNYV